MYFVFYISIGHKSITMENGIPTYKGTMGWGYTSDGTDKERCEPMKSEELNLTDNTNVWFADKSITKLSKCRLLKGNYRIRWPV
jgi:hypothetical protein